MDNLSNFSSCIGSRHDLFDNFVASVRNVIGARRVQSDNLEKFNSYCENEKIHSDLICSINDKKSLISDLLKQSNSLENEVVEASSKVMDLKTKLALVNDEISSLESENLTSNHKVLVAKGILDNCESSYKSYRESLLHIDNWKSLHDSEWSVCIDNILNKKPSSIRELLFDEFLEKSEESVLYNLLQSMFNQIISSFSPPHSIACVPTSISTGGFMTMPTFLGSQIGSCTAANLDFPTMESALPNILTETNNSDDDVARSLRVTQRVNYSENNDFDESKAGPMRSKVKPFNHRKNSKNVPKQIPQTSNNISVDHDPLLSSKMSCLL